MGIRSLSAASISTGAKRSKFWDQSSALNSYESIATATVGSGGQAEINFTSIPGTYKHLQLRGIVDTNRSAYFLDYGVLVLNSDTNTNYSLHHMYAEGTSTFSYGEPNWASAQILRFGGDGTGSIADAYGVFIVDIIDYSNTNKFKVLKNFGGANMNADAEMGLYSYLWRSTSAVTSIKITPGGGSLFKQYSEISLYGIKG
jgi:hypothetical protein